MDGSHIRTLLLTFFYRQLPELVERGYVYIAQPPLYRAARGKSEAYLKDDQELNQYLLKLAVNNAALQPGDNRPEIAGEQLETLARQYLVTDAVIDRCARFIDPQVLLALLNSGPMDLSNQAATEDSAARLTAALNHPAFTILPVTHDDTGSLLKIERKLHGVVTIQYIDEDFVLSGDYNQIKKTGELLAGLLAEDAKMRRGENTIAIKSFKQGLDWLLNEVRRNVTIQRYKGLGEMNPEQLWETTMDVTVRRLLKVNIEDAIAADEVFTTLMGDQVEPRRHFIEQNALVARNIDV